MSKFEHCIQQAEVGPVFYFSLNWCRIRTPRAMYNRSCWEQPDSDVADQFKHSPCRLSSLDGTHYIVCFRRGLVVIWPVTRPSTKFFLYARLVTYSHTLPSGTMYSEFNARQEDAHEYMIHLLESMHKRCLPSGIPAESPGAYENCLVHRIFGGCLRTQVKCLQCSNTFHAFVDLSLEIVKADSLSRAMGHFTTPELDGGERHCKCERCK